MALDLTGRTTPWDPIGDRMPAFYGGLWDLYQGGAPTPIAPGDQVAPLDPAQLAAYEAAAGFGTTGPGADIYDFTRGQLGAGVDLDQVQAYQDVYGTPTPGLNMDEVAGYVDNDLLNAQIDAALRDPYRQFTEGTLPDIDMAEASLGGGWGNRADLATDVATRGFLDRAADTSAVMRGNAYDRALQTAYGTRGQDLSYRGRAASDALGTAQRDRSVDRGVAADAYDIATGNIGLQEEGGAGRQAQEQMIRNAALRNWELENDLPWQWADRYSGLAFPAASAFGDVYGRGGPSLGEYFGAQLGSSAIEYLGPVIADWLRG